MSRQVLSPDEPTPALAYCRWVRRCWCHVRQAVATAESVGAAAKDEAETVAVEAVAVMSMKLAWRDWESPERAALAEVYCYGAQVAG